MLNSGAVDKHDLSTLTKVYTGGAPTPVAALEDWYNRTGTRIHPMYGLTEATSPTHMTPMGSVPPVDPATGVVSVGVPVFNTDVRVITEDGTVAAPHEIGELLIAGPQIVPGYWQKPEDTTEAFIDGYLRTGDVGFVDEDGWFYLVDRAKDMIVASGFKVWPREVEEVLYQHPAVLEAAVVGVPDPYRGETVKAYVSLKAGALATADDIKAFARERMAAYKYPRIVEITDEIPKNASGKVLRRLFQGQTTAPPADPTPDVRYGDLREAIEARAVLELGVVWMLAGGAQVRAGRAVGLYHRLELMLAQVRADGRYLDRGAFLDANQAYHQYLIDLADNEPLTSAFRRLGLRELFEKALTGFGRDQRTGHRPAREADRRRRGRQRPRRPPGDPDLDGSLPGPGQARPRSQRVDGDHCLFQASQRRPCRPLTMRLCPSRGVRHNGTGPRWPRRWTRGRPSRSACFG